MYAYMYAYIYEYIYRYIHICIFIVIGNVLSDLSLNLDEAVCISHIANTLGNDLYPITLSPAMGE